MGHCTRRLFVSWGSVAGLAAQNPPSKGHGGMGHWDKVYAAKDPIFSLKPTALLVEAIQGRKAGRALDIGMGQGRNAIFLAQSGWEVTGFDPSAEGVRQAQDRARRLGLRLLARVSREEDFDWSSAAYDLIVMTYVRRLVDGDGVRFSRALRPGGLFVFENNNVGDRNEALRQFLDFRILRFEDVEAQSDWHPRKRQRVERLVAEKPLSSPAE